MSQHAPCATQQKTISPDWHWASDLQPFSTVPRLLAYLLAVPFSVKRPKKKKIYTYTPLCESLLLETRPHSGQDISVRFQIEHWSLTHWTNENRRGCFKSSWVKYWAISKHYSWFWTTAVLSFSPLLLSMPPKIPLLTMWKAKCGDAIPYMTSIKHFHSPEAQNNPTNSTTPENLFSLIS